MQIIMIEDEEDNEIGREKYHDINIYVSCPKGFLFLHLHLH